MTTDPPTSDNTGQQDRISNSAAPEHVCDGYDWRSGLARPCALRLGHRGSCSGDPCEHPVYMDGRCYDCGAPHPEDCDCGPHPPRPEPICTGCHEGDFRDFDHYCDTAGIKPGEEPAAFAAWLNAISGWDGPMEQVSDA